MNKQIGHIYIIDLQASEEAYCWMLCGILLHGQSFMRDKDDLPQRTSMAKLKINSLALQAQMLSIQHALMDGRHIYAEIAFNPLKLLEEVSHNMPNLTGELIELNHLVVEYRRKN